MRPTNSQRYTSVAIGLHWAIALFIAFNLSLGFCMEGFPKPLKAVVVRLHPEIPAWERAAAHSAHALLYLLMLAMTLTGWSIISAHPANPQGGPRYFGLFRPAPPFTWRSACSILMGCCS